MSKVRRSITPKKIAASLLALYMALSCLYLPASAADADGQVLPFAGEYGTVSAMTAKTDDGVYSESKTPKQVNVHMGDDPSTQVNFTYSTIEDAATRVVLNIKGESEEVTVDGDAATGQAGKYIHAITVSDLAPGTQYEYTVGFGANTYRGSFKTAPEKGSRETIRFAFMADTQVSNATNAKALGATLSTVNSIPDLDFVYIAGDITDTATNESQWEYLFNNSGSYPNGGQDMFGNNLLAVVQGNHDNNVLYRHINAPAQQGNIVYSFDYGPITFIMLNLESARYDATAREAQKVFLQEKVTEARSRGQWTAVGFHKSLVTGASHITDSDVVEARKFWVPVFAELDVDMVLQGHDHVYSRGFVTGEGQKAEKTTLEDGAVMKPGNAPLYMVGGHAGGLKWYSKKNYTVAQGDPIASGYSFLDVNSTDVGPNGEPGSDVKKEQVIVEMEVGEDTLTVNTYMFKYDTATDTITTPKYLYDSVTVRREAASQNKLSLTTDAHLVEAGKVFDVQASFDEAVNSNAAVLEYKFDTAKYEYRRFTPAENMSLLNTEKTDDGVKLTVMAADYDLKSLGEIRFMAKADADIQNEDNAIELHLQYVVKDDGDNKEIYTAVADTTFTSSGGTPGTGEDGEVTLIDLSNVIDMFGADTTHEKWNEYRFYDYNNNGVIDVQDIAAVAKKIK